MQWAKWVLYLPLTMLTLPHLTLAQTPLFQLTVQPARLPNHNDYAGGTLLRELQRQALLISAREELGLATRDMVLREPFSLQHNASITTLLCSTQVQKSQSAQLLLSRFDSDLPSDPFSLANQPINSNSQTLCFTLSKNTSIDYLDFVTRCEEASRTTYLKALQDQRLLNNITQHPTQWAPADAPADPDALLRLQHLDVFSQYLAVRKLHTQIRSEGGSATRISALVRGYANLSQLTRNQWSQANKAFAARALLYAQRLVIHENNSPVSLYSRAYARALVGLHAAALQDLADAKQLPPPEWILPIKAWCNYDLNGIEALLAQASWRTTQLSLFVAAKIAADAFPTDRQQAVTNRAVTNFPGLFILDALETSDSDTIATGDQIISQLPTILDSVLSNGNLPPAAQAQVRQVEAGEKTFRQLAALRDELTNAALKSPRDTDEPSYGVLADLIEQQAFTGIVNRSVIAANTGSKIVQTLSNSAQTILKIHPWNAYIQALALENPADDDQINQTLKNVKDKDVGPWIARTISDNYRTPAATNKLIKAWLQAADRSTDALIEDYVPPDPSADAPTKSHEHSVISLLETSPHSGTLLLEWMKNAPDSSIQKNTSRFEETIATIENHFSDRPALLQTASDWCCTRGDFPRSLALLLKLDALETSPHVCDEMALVQYHLGQHSRAIENLLRGAKQTDETTEKASLYQRAVYFLIQQHQFDAALNYLQLSAEVPTARVWQMTARCYDAMGEPKQAQDSLTQLAMLDPSTVAQQYLWARRFNRPDVETIHKQALAAIAGKGENFFPHFFVCMADNQEPQALTLLRNNREQMDDAMQYAQLIILANKLHSHPPAANNLNVLHNRGGSHQAFGDAFKSFIQTKDVNEAIANFNVWTDRQLDDEDAVDWFSLVGRYLAATGHVTQAKHYLTRAIRTTVTEREDYYLAWRELLNLGENPASLRTDPTTQPHAQ